MTHMYCKMPDCIKYSLFSALWVLQLLAAQQLSGQNIQLSFSTMPPACNGYTNGTVTVNATGGTAPYAYLWNNGQAGQTNLGVGAGLVSVTVTDQNGQAAIGSTTVSQPTQIVAAVSPTGMHCLTGGGTLNGSATGGTPPYTYAWGNGSTSSSVPVTGSGAYSLTVTDANGCSDLESYFVQPPLSVVVEVENIPCFMFCDGVARAIVSGGTPPYSYLWNNGATTQQIVSLMPGWYAVIVTDAGGCSVGDSAYLYEPPAITIDFNTIAPACGGSTGSATAQASGGTPPFTYLWSYNNVVGPTLSNVPAGTYFVQVTDANGCQKSMPIGIPVGTGLNVSLAVQNSACPGVNDGTVTAIVAPGAGTYTYQWNVQNATGPVVNGLAANTSVCVTITDVNTGCQGRVCSVVGGNASISLQVADTDVSCPADLTGTATATPANGTAPYTYLWTNPTGATAATPMISGLGAGAYTVQVTDNRGCTAAGVANIGVLSTLNAAYELSVVTCEDDFTQIRFTDKSADPGSTIVAWQWTIISGAGMVQSNLQNPIVRLPANETGTLQLFVTSAAGCTDSISGTFQVDSLPNVSLDVAASAFNCDGSPVRINVTGDPSYTYTWLPMTGLTFDPGPQNVIANPAQTQIYTLIAGNGSCVDTVQVEVIRQTPLSLSVGTHELVTCTTTATLQATVNTAATVQWFDASGVPLAPGTTITVPASAVPTQYRVVATAALGCTQTDSVTVTGKAVSISLNVLPEVSNCANGPIPINVVGAPAYTYTWSPMAGLAFPDPTFPNVIANPTVTTDYQLIATNGFCSDTARVKVVRVVPIDLAIQNPAVTSCEPTATLTATINAASNATVVWQPGGQTGLSITVPATAAPTTYTAVATDPAGCSQSATATLVGHATDVSVTATTPTMICAGQPILLSAANANPNDVLTYQWTATSAAISITPNNAANVTVAGAIGTYVVNFEATNQFGCTYQQAIPVTFLSGIQEEVTGSTTVCTGKSVQLNPEFNPAYTYLWSASPADPTLDPNSPNPTVTPTATTTYTLQVSSGGCMATYTAQVLPQATSMLSIGDDYRVCSDDPVTLSVQNPVAGANYQWSQTETFNIILAEGSTIQVTPEKNGIYYVRSEADGCVNQGSIRVNNTEVTLDALGRNRNLCLGETTQLTVTNVDLEDNLIFTWTPALDTVFNPTVTPTSDAAYSVVVSNQFGCRDTVNFNVRVVELAITAEVTGKTTICPGQSTTLLATATGTGTVFTYVWTPAATLNDPNIANPTARPDAETVYTVTATADGLCPDTASVTIFFEGDQCIEPYIFVPKAFSPNGDESNDRFIVRGNNIKELYMVVWDRWGEKVYETEDTQTLGWDGTFQGATLTPDAYAWYVKATCGNGAVYTKKGNVTLLK